MSVLVNETCVTDPLTGIKKGDAVFATDHLRFQIAANFTSGQFEYTGSLGQSFDCLWDAWTGGGSGADASWFYWGASVTPTQEDSAQNQYGVVLSEFSDQIQLRFNGTTITSVAYANLDNSTWRTIRIRVYGQTIQVWVNGIIQINYGDTVRALGSNLFGWGGRSGGTNNEHRARNLFVQSPYSGGQAAIGNYVQVSNGMSRSEVAN